MRAVYVEALDSHRALSDDALAASLAAALARRPAHADWWVFAYGSLLWNPLFPFVEARPATLRGKHRRFCLWSLASRGTTKSPGLVLGLDQGGTCHGVVYRLPAECAHAELALLWRREMVVGAYQPRWLRVRAVGASSNKSGLGTIVRVTSAAGTQWQAVHSGSSYASQSELTLTFGLAEDARVSKLELVWPSGKTQTFTDLASNQVVVVDEASGIVSR